jgi:hypothetical protein
MKLKSPLPVLCSILMMWSPCFGQETILHYLSGRDKDHTEQWDFYCSAGRNSGTWSKIPVPSCWELQGFGTYHYGWEENYKENETGFYKFRFLRQPSWKNKIVRLVFEGSMTDTEVKINGKSAGPKHQGSFYRFKYDITSLLKAENLLEVSVSKISSDTSVNRAERMSDFWVFGGIYRPVYVEILPEEYIDWTAIDARADGSFMMNVYPIHVKHATHVEAQIMTLDGEPVGQPFITALSKSNRSSLRVSTQIDNPRTWNPEDPNLYKVQVTLKKGEQAIHTVTENFGFRTVEFREGVGFFVNGKKIMFKGVNRHSFWPASGRTTSKAISTLDVNLIKEMNMNAVRMAHYPPDAHFLEVCDSLGLFVLDELGGWQKKYDTPVGRRLVKETVMKDVNHPSIVIWDNGNEGGNNHELVDEFAKYDPQKRKVIHPWNIFQGTDTQHYKGYDCCAGSLYHGNTVFFPTEIIHGLYDGGNGAALNDHWNLMLSNPLSAGCFLWAFADEGIVRHDRDSTVDVKGDRGPDGIVGPFREKEGSFFTIKEIWSPVQVKNKKLSPAFDGTIEVENKYFYTDLSTITFSWKLEKFAGPDDASDRPALIYSGSLQGPPVAPQQSGKIKLNLPSEYVQADVLSLTATDRFNHEIFTWTWALKTPAEISERLNKNMGAGSVKPSVTEDENTIQVSANGVTIGFDKKSGRISSVKNTASAISFSNGPVLENASARLLSVKHYAIEDQYVIEVNYEGDLKRLSYTMSKDGVLKMNYAYSHYRWASENAFNNLGINFNYPEEKITGVKYLGNGPYRVWKNRMKGGSLGVWRKKYNNTITGLSWDYPEFKGFYSDFFWAVIENTESPFLIYTDTRDLFLRLYTPGKPAGDKNIFTAPEFPSGDISFLHGINAIGTKFDAASNHGPEGAKNKIGPEWITGTLYFDFRSRR